MNCNEIQEKLSDLLDGILSPAEVEKVRAHFRDCRDCEEHFRELEKTVQALHFVGEAEPPADFADRVMGALEKENVVGKRRRVQIISLTTISSLAALFLLLILFDPMKMRSHTVEAELDDTQLASSKAKDAKEIQGENLKGFSAGEMKVLHSTESYGMDKAPAPEANSVENLEEDRESASRDDFSKFDSGNEGAEKPGLGRVKKTAPSKTAEKLGAPPAAESKAAQPAAPVEQSLDLLYFTKDYEARKRQIASSDQDEKKNRGKKSAEATPPTAEPKYYVARFSDLEGLNKFKETLPLSQQAGTKAPSKDAPAAGAPAPSEMEFSATKGGAKEQEKSKQELKAGLLAPQGTKAVRLILPAAQAEKLVEEWKKISGVNLQEFPLNQLPASKAQAEKLSIASSQVELVILVYETIPPK